MCSSEPAVGPSFAAGGEGFTYGNRYLLISTDLEFARYLPGLCFVNYLADPDEYAMRLRIPDIWRVMVRVAPGVPEVEVRRPDRMRRTVGALVNDAIDWACVRVATYQLYQVHQRIASRLQRRAGDPRRRRGPSQQPAGRIRAQQRDR